MTELHLEDATLDAPIQGTHLGGAGTLREALGDVPTIVLFVRHFG